MRLRSVVLVGFFMGVALLGLVSTGDAGEQMQPMAGAKLTNDQNPQSEIAKYCFSNANAAADMHLAWQRDKLAKMEEELKQKIAELQAKQEEYKKWVVERQELLAKGEDGVVAIFSHMSPDAAALQLAAMEDEIAAAVLTKLNPRNASAILGEIDPQRAARLTAVMAGTVKKLPDAKKSL